MKTFFLISLTIFMTATIVSCSGSKSFFNGKVLIYNSIPPKELGLETSNAAFIDFDRDSINWIDQPFDTATLKNPLMYPQAYTPFMFEKEDKTIFINYSIRGEQFRKPYFQLSVNDSIIGSSFIYLCGHKMAVNSIVTRYTGLDTIIKIEDKKVKCWIFDEMYPLLKEPDQVRKIIYLDKQSLLPVQIITTYLQPVEMPAGSSNPETFTSRIVSVLKRPWNSTNKKWRHSKCVI